MKSSNILRDSVIVGFAMFAMFFGAGNIIFPPYVGVVSGDSWFWPFVIYFIADIGLAVLTLIAMLTSRTIDHFLTFMGPLGPICARLLMTAAVCCSCVIATPRTATVSFELGIAPIFGESANLMVYSIIYFIAVWAFCLRESKVIDYVGKILTPALVVGLVIMIIVGIVSPLGAPIDSPQIDNIYFMGLISGYQTMDVVGALVFSYIISRALTAKGYGTPELKIKAVLTASWVLAILMFVVYGGLCYLGATASSLYGADVRHGTLVVELFQRLLGYNGSVLLGVTTALACLTTGIALTSAFATYLCRLTNDRLKYRPTLTVICFTFAMLANLGLATIISLAVPVLLIVYPACLVMVFLSLFAPRIKNNNIYKIPVAFAVVFSILEVIHTSGAPIDLLTYFPLQSYGFGWILPVLAGLVIGFFLKTKEEAAA